jgi:sentrin-specific protease 1
MVKLDMNWEEGELLGFIGNGSGTDATKAVSEKVVIDLFVTAEEKETIDLCKEDDDVVLFLQTKSNERVGDYRVTQSELDEVDVVCNVPLTRDDLRTCVGENWLNSRIIDCYSILVQEQSDLKICVVSILVYTDAKNLGASAAARKHLNKLNFDGLDLIMFPMTLGTNRRGGGGQHHVLCVIDCIGKSVRIYDSKMGSEQRHDQRANTMLDCLAEKASMDNRTFDKKEWKIEHVGQDDTPQQHNGHDCGVFVCTLAYFLSKRKDMETEIKSHNCLVANYMALQRNRIIMSLLNPRYPISMPFVD